MSHSEHITVGGWHCRRKGKDDDDDEEDKVKKNNMKGQGQ
jgi:hypothetical protein